MKRIYYAAFVGLALLMSGAAARATDFGDYRCNNHDGQDYCFNFKTCDDNGNSNTNSYDNNSGDCDDHSSWCGDNDCHHHDRCGGDAAPLPPASALGGAGLMLVGAAKWLRSRRTTIA